MTLVRMWSLADSVDMKSLQDGVMGELVDMLCKPCVRPEVAQLAWESGRAEIRKAIAKAYLYHTQQGRHELKGTKKLEYTDSVRDELGSLPEFMELYTKLVRESRCRKLDCECGKACYELNCLGLWVDV